jgi:hypothetical protein
MERQTDRNREAWLTDLARAIVPTFRGYDLGRFRVTCGWPCHNAISLKKRVVGQCFGVESSTDGVSELFISPVLDRPLEVAGTLVHELAHVAAGVREAHKGKFLKVCRMVGLTKGKPTSVMPGAALDEVLLRLLEPLGRYPHAAIKPTLKLSKPSKNVTLVCVCGFRCSCALKRLTETGEPTCGCGKLMQLKSATEEDNE